MRAMPRDFDHLWVPAFAREIAATSAEKIAQGYQYLGCERRGVFRPVWMLHFRRPSQASLDIDLIELNVIARTVQSWLDWQESQLRDSGYALTDDSTGFSLRTNPQMRAVIPRGLLKAWVATLCRVAGA